MDCGKVMFLVVSVSQSIILSVGLFTSIGKRSVDLRLKGVLVNT